MAVAAAQSSDLSSSPGIFLERTDSIIVRTVSATIPYRRYDPSTKKETLLRNYTLKRRCEKSTEAQEIVVSGLDSYTMEVQ